MHEIGYTDLIKQPSFRPITISISVINYSFSMECISASHSPRAHLKIVMYYTILYNMDTVCTKAHSSHVCTIILYLHYLRPWVSGVTAVGGISPSPIGCGPLHQIDYYCHQNNNKLSYTENHKRTQYRKMLPNRGTFYYKSY